MVGLPRSSGSAWLEPGDFPLDPGTSQGSRAVTEPGAMLRASANLCHPERLAPLIPPGRGLSGEGAGSTEQ